VSKKKDSLTAEQQASIDSLTQSFRAINMTTSCSGGLINIAKITDHEHKKKQRDEEISLMQKSNDIAREKIVANDFAKIRPDIEAMGLKIEHGYKTITIKQGVSGKNSVHDLEFKIYYEYAYQQTFVNEYSGYNRAVYSGVTIQTTQRTYGNDKKYHTIEEFLKDEEKQVNEELGTLYRRTQEILNDK
jgi:hypothetical protein